MPLGSAEPPTGSPSLFATTMRHLDPVNSLLTDRALIFGSLPPGGRDLDLLVRPPEEEALSRGLPAAGFLRRGDTLVRFDPDGPEIVDLTPASSWGLPASELAELYSQSRPLADWQRLARPAPHHVLLILARRLMRAGGELEPRHRARVQAALTEDPDAWNAARERTVAWQAAPALAALESAYSTGTPVSRAKRVGAITSDRRRRGGSRRQAGADVARAFLPRPRLGHVVALSGLDGAGKSSQAASVRDALDRLGYLAVTEWPAIHGPSGFLHLMSRVGRRLLAPSQPASEAGDGQSPEVGGGSVHQRSPFLTLVWAALVSGRGALHTASKTWPHVARGRVVICDRYLLDSWVHLKHQFDAESDYRAHMALLRLLAPRPLRAYLIEVAPEVAAQRKAERTVEENVERARLYRDLAPVLGVRAIDGRQPRETIGADIARDVWEALG